MIWSEFFAGFRFCLLHPIRSFWHVADHALSWAYTKRLWGPRCPDVDGECATCRAWLAHDIIFNSKETSE